MAAARSSGSAGCQNGGKRHRGHERANKTAAVTGCSVERRGQAEPSEQQNTESRRVQGALVETRQGREKPRNKRPRLRLQQGKEGGSSYRRSHGKRAAASSVDKLVRVWRDNGRVRGQVAEGERLEASVTEKADITGEGVQTAGL